ncbi:MAG: hypothetical protein KGD59_10700 [Candidatus Heimdallarchaeota archaeon]|nr:hypothetical protein [Candidatus Heimdallarchaeota archaeon]MBY8995008.1 hypothetical protein [Candidatus Heimdallarchaeota archaeon]
MSLSNFAIYHVWAGDKIRTIIEKLSKEEFTKNLGEYFSHNSIHELCLHSLGACEFCLALVDKIDPDIFSARYKDLMQLSQKELLEEWKKTDYKYSQLLQGNVKGKILVPPFLGNSFKVSKLDFLLQYVTHSTYHRGQIIIALKKLGKEVVGTDYLFFLNEITTE